MSISEDYLIALKHGIKEQNYPEQIRVISNIAAYIEKSESKAQFIQKLVNMNFANAFNDAISTDLNVLLPTLRLLRFFIKDVQFRRYQFHFILKNIIRVLVFVVQTEEIIKSHLEFYDSVTTLNFLLKIFLTEQLSNELGKDMQTTFVCLLKFIDLVLSRNFIALPVKNLMVEIFFNLLNLNRIYKVLINDFELVMRVAALGDVFLENFVIQNRKDNDELWLYKIVQVLFCMLESVDHLDKLQVQVFENVFFNQIDFVLDKLLILKSSKLFKLCISLLNVVLFTPSFSTNICKLLKQIVKLHADRFVLVLSKSSMKINKHTRYTMKIFLSALVTHSDVSLKSNHTILEVLLQSPLQDSILHLTPCEIVKNSKALMLLYGCSIIRHIFIDSQDANRVLENLTIILNVMESSMTNDDIWTILRTFSYFSNYAALSALQHAGVRKISENLLIEASRILKESKDFLYKIDKYVISFAYEFSTNKILINSLIFKYLNQKPELCSSKIGQIVPTTNILPFLISNELNQVDNAVKILKGNHLSQEDMAFIVGKCFLNIDFQEFIIGGAICLIEMNIHMVSTNSINKIYEGSIAHLESKQVKLTLSLQCYYCIIMMCIHMIRFNVKIKSVEDY